MKVRWGLIGTSTIARSRVVSAIRDQPDGEIVAVMSSNADRARDFAKETSIPRSYGTVDSFLADAEIDAVYISTTNELHGAQTIAAARVGKHVLCEKPLATSLKQGLAMVHACEQASVVLATNHHMRAASSHIAMRDAVRAGRIGKPVGARVFHAIYLPEPLQGWRLDRPDAGGGAILDLTVHDIDALRFILDEDPVEVTAMVQTSGMATNAIEDACMTVVRFSSGLLAQTHDAFTVKHGPTGIDILGTKGSLRGDDIMGQVPGGEVLLRTESGSIELPLNQEGLYTRTIRQFHLAVRKENQPFSTGRDGLWSLTTALAARESALSGRPTAIEPVA